MEIEHEKIKQVTAGHIIGIKVNGRLKENDTVYKTE
jgi:hypothetical protein